MCFTFVVLKESIMCRLQSMSELGELSAADEVWVLHVVGAGSAPAANV